MPDFDYVARSADGQLVRSSEEAASATDVVAMLRHRGWSVVDVRPPDRSPRFAAVGLRWPTSLLPVRSLDVELCLGQLALMLSGGVGLLEAFRLAAGTTRSRRLAAALREVARLVQEGSSLTLAMQSQGCFPALVIQLTRVGELTGNLDTVLFRAAEAIERRRHLRSALASAVTYPAVVLVAAISVSSFMVFYVIPQLEQFLHALGRELPAITQLLLSSSTAIRRYAGGGVSLSAALLAAVWLLRLYPPGRMQLDAWLLRVPILGGLLRVAATAHTARGLALLLRSGVALLDALQTVASLPRNQYTQRRLTTCREQILHGETLSRGLRDRWAFTPLLASMAAVGESSGALDDVLDKTAEFHEKQLGAAIRRLGALVEPAIILVVGSVVGFVYLAFFVALFAAAGSG